MNLGVTIIDGKPGSPAWKVEDLLRKLAGVDFRPLMEGWEKILQVDNRRGLMQGLDGEGEPMEPVTYRPKPVNKVDLTILPHGNLASSHYRSLSGPPLVPRGLGSRAITKFRTSNGRMGDGDWFAAGAWEDVLDVKGRPFLSAHFEGRGKLPKRDLRGARPQALAEASAALHKFLDGFFSTFPEAGPAPHF